MVSLPPAPADSDADAALAHLHTTIATQSRRIAELEAAIERQADQVHIQTEQTLHERDEQLRLAYDAAELGSWRRALTPPARDMFLDERAQIYYGYTSERFSLDVLLERVHPDDRTRVATLLDALDDQPASVDRTHIEYRLIHPDGSLHWMLVHVRVLFDEAGPTRRPLRVIGAVQDITARKNDEQELLDSQDELRASERRFRLLAEHAQDLIYRYRLIPPIGFEYVSPSATLLTGYTPEEHYADPLLGMKLVHPADRALLERIGTDPDASGELIALRWHHKNGKTIWMEQINRLITDAEGTPVAIEGIARDITARKLAEQELRAAADQLQVLSRRLVEAHERERRSIARELHDEVGQVLTGLKLSLAAAQDAPPETRTATLADAQSAISELMGRIRGISLDLRPALLDDLGLLPAIGWYLTRYTTRTGIQVDLRHHDIDRRFPAEVETVAYRTIQEALTNVARYAGVTTAAVRLIADEQRLMLRVDDDGSGFAQTPVGTVATTGGLSGMAERVKMIGGVLTIEAEPGAGTHIIAELPLTITEAE